MHIGGMFHSWRELESWIGSLQQRGGMRHVELSKGWTKGVAAWGPGA
jgi:hypothetical protein